ncbi:MAG: hypothetical protein V2B19_03690 [Pseudomonadota bacterium]
MTDGEILEKERANDLNVDRIRRFQCRTRYFTDSGIIGTKAFVAENYQRFKHLFHSKHEKSRNRLVSRELMGCIL